MDGIMSNKLFATRQGTIFLGVIAAIIAAIALIVYLNNYRNSVNNNAAITVLTAKSLIQKGTSGSVVGASELYKVSHVTKSNLQTDALADPSELNGQVAVKDIYPGQQLTATDFGPATGSVSEDLTPTQRAVSVPLGAAQQVSNQIGAGSHVDVWMTITKEGKSGSFPVTTLLLQDAYVLGAGGGNATLRVTPRQAGEIIWGSQNAQLWLALRPTVATNVTQPPVVGG